MSTSILLINPKYGHNVGAAVRAAACFGAHAVTYTGDRVPFEGTRKETRIPREERLRAFRDVKFKHVDWDHKNNNLLPGTPVCVELSPTAELLPDFEHPEDVTYVFGPEDGSVPTAVRSKCHRHVVIPAVHCTNLAAAIYIVLYDRQVKRVKAGLERPRAAYELLSVGERKR